MPTISLVLAQLRRSTFASLFQASLFFLGCAASLAIPVHATAAVHTPGKFSVSDLGAATYTVPIAIPPGTAGIAPSLSLSFNSQANAGLLGRGWSLGGLSSITRCAQTPGQDGAGLGEVQFDANDRFCLDGQRLMVSNGLTYGANNAEYRTENDSFSQIISYGGVQGPTWFKVWTKAGRVLEYGNTADSRIEAQGRAEVRTWAINREQDIKGNFLIVSYTEDNANGDFYPVRIDYTGNANTGTTTNNSVRFSYEPLPILIPGYKKGSLIQATVRLKAIDAYQGENRTHDYQLSYVDDALTKRSRLNGIKQCQGDGVTCLPAIKFDWQAPGTYGSTAGEWVSPGFVVDGNIDSKTVMAIDLNGDGKTDLLQHVQRDGQSWLIPMYSNGTGFTIGEWIPLGRIYSDFLVADVDGNGLADLISVATGPDGIRKVDIFMSTGAGFIHVNGGSHHSDKIPDRTYLGGYGYPLALDIDGDGKAELVEFWHDGLLTYEMWISISKFNGTTFNPPAWKKMNTRRGKYVARTSLIPLDINGDGKMDLLETWAVEGDGTGNIWTQPMLSNGTDFVSGEWRDSGFFWRSFNYDGPNAVQQILPLDMNGDGMMDLMFAGQVLDDQVFLRTNFKLRPFYSNGVNFIQGKSEVLPGETGAVGEMGMIPDFLTASDINGDGKTDLLLTWYGRAPTFDEAKLFIQPLISEGQGFLLNQSRHDTGQKWATVYHVVEDPDGNYIRQAVSPEFIVLDINGDGKMDLVQQRYKQSVWNQPSEASYFLPYLTDSGIGDLMIGITNGLGAKTTMHYTPLTDSATYVRDADTDIYPMMNVQMPMYVIASADLPNGNGGSDTLKYRYGGLKKDRSRNELTGFRWKEEQQLSTGLTSLVEYRQDWPYAGMVLKSTTSLAGRGHGNLLSQTDSQFGCIDTLDGLPCVRRWGRSYFPFVSQSSSQKWDLNGTALPVQTSTAAYDVWGNATSSTTSVSDGGQTWSTQTVNTYNPADTSTWVIGQLKRTSVTNTVPAYTGPALPSGEAGIPGEGNGGGNNGGGTPGSGMQASTVSWVAGFAPPAQAYPGRTVALQVQVSGAAPLVGTVTFFDGNAALAVIALDGAGKASFSMVLNGIGTHALRAEYSGDANHAASSTGAAVAVTIDLTPIMMILLDD